MKLDAMMKWIARVLAVACCIRAHADGGAVVDRGHYGAFDVTVFLSPVPPCAGAIDFSILVSRNGEPQLSTPVHVRADGPGGAWNEVEMHSADSGNRLLRACSLTLGSPGVWRISILIGDGVSDRGSFDISVNPAPPPWRASLPWMVLWIPAALILVAREKLITNQRRRRGAWRESDQAGSNPERFSASIL